MPTIQSTLVQSKHLPIAAYRDDPGIFNRLSRLPALRPATLQLLSVSVDSDSAIADLENVFKADPVLAADLLILANSPAFGMRATVNSIRHAIALLGLEQTRSLAFAVAMKSYMLAPRWGDTLQDSWRHSIATAVIAEMLASASGTEVPFLYTAGLMHDVGRLALFQLSGEKYQQVLATEFASVREYLNREKLLFGCGHDDAGAFLAEAWGFPTTLCDCIRFHHWDVAMHAGQLFELVGVACSLADALGFPEVCRADRMQGPEAVLTLLPARLRESPLLRADLLKTKINKQLETFQNAGLVGARSD